VKNFAWHKRTVARRKRWDHVTRLPCEIGRLAQDLAGGLMVTLPSERELRHETIGPIIEKYLKGRADIPTEDRIRILRLVENMTLGPNAVGYLTESMHGAGSPQAQRIQIARSMQIEFKKELARTLAGINSASREEIADELSSYMARVFAPVRNQ
jgi:4-hydroxybutyryl-CoA dehydratase / vinylacetyl-CoA-Delta-isomerase